MVKTANPFPGLRPFRPDESALFFGRDEQIGEALDRLLERRLLAVVGVSGCGKSSLVQAGMLPALEMGLAGDPAQRWRIATMRPGDGPIRGLVKCLDCDDDALAARSYGLLEAANNHLATGENLLLVVDQFEEIFPFRDRKLKEGAGSEADLFVSYLLRAAQDPAGRVYVLLTMRSDYLGECAKFHGLPEALNDGQYLVPRMTRQQLQEAIEGPLQAADVKMHPALLQDLLNQCDEEPDNLPLLQHLLWRLFEEWPGEGPITREMAAAVGGLGGALDQDASRVLAALDDEQKRVAEVVFRRITESRRQADREEDDRPVRRPQRVASLALLAEVSESALRAVVARFEERGLLVVRSTDAGDMVDLPHECLCLKWAALREWIRLEAEDAKRLRFLKEATHRETPLAGCALGEALVWQSEKRFETAWGARYITPLEVVAVAGWVRESGRRVDEAAERERAAHQAALRQVEERRETERRLAEAERLRQEEKQGAERQQAAERLQREVATREAARQQAEAKRQSARNTAVVLGLAALGFAALGAWAWVQKSLVNTHAAVAFAQQFATRSGLVFGEHAIDIERAALLATRSMGLQPTFDGDRALRRPLMLLRRTRFSLALQGRVWDVAWSPDGEWLATGSDDGTARVMEARSGKELGRLVHQGPVNAVAWSPDGKWLATGSYDKTARVMEARSGKELGRLVHQGPVTAVAWSPDGTRVAIGSEDKTARVMEARSGKELGRLTHYGKVYAIAWSPDGKNVVTGSGDNKTRVIDANSGKELAHLACERPVLAVAWSPDGKRVATGSADNVARVMEASTGRELASLTHDGRVNAVAWSPDGKWVATGSYDHMTRVMDANSGKEIARLTHEDIVTAVAWSPDGKWVATGSDKTVRVIEASRGVELVSQGIVNSLAWSPDGKWVATGSDDGTARVMDASSGKELARLTHEDIVNAVAWSPDGKWVATGSYDQTARVMDASSGKELYRIAHEDIVNAVAWSPDGKWVATGSEDETARVMDAGSGKELHRITHGLPVSMVAWSPDSKRVATGSEDSTVRVMEALSGRQLPSFVHEARVNCLSWSPDGRSLAAGSDDKTARVMDARTGSELARVVHQGLVSLVAWSPNGKWIVTQSEDVRVMDAATGGERVRIGIAATGTRFSNDGRSLEILQRDAATKGLLMTRHPLDPQDLIREACEKLTRNLTLSEWHQYVSKETPYARSCDNLPFPPDYKK